MKSAIETLKKKAEANAKLMRSGYVKALEDVVNNDFPTQRLRITMHTNDPGWIEVDAVELVGLPSPVTGL